MTRRSILMLTAVLLAGKAWAQDQRPVGALKSERVKRGDTLVVRTLAGSTWGDKVRLVEDLRIGSKEGDGPDSFGSITSFTIFPDGVLAVFDQSVPALRLFDASGKHLRTLGRDGAGPGEYRNASLGLAVDRDGVLIMYDPRNSRLNRWKEDGTVLPSWYAPGRLYANHTLQVDNAGGVYVLITIVAPEPGKPWKFGLARLDGGSTIRDTLLPPRIEGDQDPAGPYFYPQVFWFRNRSGETVTAFGGRYAITLAPASGPPRRIERVSPQIQVASAERANFQAAQDAIRENPIVRQVGLVRPIPGTKPYLRELEVDFDGRIWVRLHVQAEAYDPPPQPKREGGLPALPPIRWREAPVWDVFRPDGTYLGQVQLPWRTSFSQAKGDHVWAIQRGEDDEQYIVRYRITGP